MSIELATAYVSVVPSVRGIRRDLERQIIAPASAAGTEAGQKSGRNFSAGFSSVLGGMAKTIAGVTAGALAAGGAITAFGVKGAANLETVTTAFTSLLGSSKAATDEITQLQAFAAKTPFSQQDVFGYAQQYLSLANSVGLAKDQVQPFLTTIGNIAAVTGASTENIHNAVLAIGQIGSSGKVTLDNLNQISEAFPGFNGAAAIASATGQTTAQVMKEIGKGSIDAQTGVQALLKGMQDFPGAAGAMEKQSKTLKGVWSTFTDTVQISLTQAFQPLIPTIKTVLSDLTPVIASSLATFAPAITTFVQQLVPVLQPLLTGLSTVFTSVFQALGPALAALAPVIQPLATAFAQFVQAISPLLTFAAQIVSQFGPPLIGIFQSLLTAVQPLVAVFISSFQPVLPVIAQALAQIGQALAPVVAALAGALTPVLPVVAQAVADLARALAPVVATLGQAFVQFITALAPSLPVVAKAGADLAVALAQVLQQIAPMVTLAAKFSGLGLGEALQAAVVPAQALASALRGLAGIVSLIKEALALLHTSAGSDAFVNELFGGKGSWEQATAAMKAAEDGAGTLAAGVQHAGDSFATMAVQALEAKYALAAVGLGAQVTAADVLGVTNSIIAMAGAIAAARGQAALALGLSAVAQAQAIADAAKASAGLTLPSLTNPSLGAAGAANKPPAFDVSTLTSFLSTAGITKNPLTDALNAIFASARAAGKTLSNGLVNQLKSQNSELIGLTKQRDKIAAQLQNAQQRLANLIQQRNQEASTIKQAVTGTFNVGAIPKPQYGEPITLRDIMRRLNKAVANARSFNSVLRRLARAGLPAGLLQQLAEAGPDALPAARALLTASPKQLKEIKSQFRELTRQGSSIGRFVANDMYKSGIDAARGIVRGLRSQQSALNAAIRSLAKSMVKELRDQLGIHSPSQVLHELGAFSGEGFAQGLASKTSAVQSSAALLANGALPRSQAAVWAGRAGTAGMNVTVHQTIQNPLPEVPSVSGPAAIRRAAYALDR